MTKQADRPDPAGRMVAAIYAPLKAEYLVELVEALEQAVGEKLYIRSGLEFWAHGELIDD